MMATDASETMVEDAVGAEDWFEELHVFDFDGTLVDTPTPKEGMRSYEIATGREWPFQGWWGRAESLEPPLTMASGPALDEYRESAANATVARVMMTGRRGKLRQSVEAVMRSFDINCHEHIFNCTGHDTLSYKQNELRRLVKKYKPKRVRIWEDRISHAREFQDMDVEFRSTHGVESWRVTLVEPSNDF